ncbi:MAG: MBL fold metallo-hydrolase [Bifidobacteriaceae bacterium]|jgi:glyoxylase-like metal-dependent hydrolase (beta-lactamase superfamily II)|nr:MBL fold metallo-hydrolase [Bifidobacteriaceae bacterium]
MFIASGASGSLQANWYVVGADGSDRCVVIDPGEAAAGPCREQIAASGRAPTAVLATHGHVDHIADAAELADFYGIPLYIHASDRPFLTDPAAATNSQFAALLPVMFPGPWREPADVRTYGVEATGGRGALAAADLEFELRHAPGHTPGSTMLIIGGDSDPTVFAGDVVFAGSIGRTDFLVGSPGAMRRSLKRQLLTLPDAARILPGHGPATDLARERRHNPYLSAAFWGV